ncbi:hypothetical protein TruAng_001076 [Truncatella angustata]|nr:hypothetical protein TruAng_001076 [Truncatella angustata]
MPVEPTLIFGSSQSMVETTSVVSDGEFSQDECDEHADERDTSRGESESPKSEFREIIERDNDETIVLGKRGMNTKMSPWLPKKRMRL